MDSFKNLLSGGDKKDQDDKKKKPPQDEDQPLKAPDKDIFGSFNELKTNFTKQMDNAKQEAENAVQSVREDIKTKVSALDDTMKSMLSEYKLKINIWVRSQVQAAILKFLESMRPKVKAAAKDPDMCNFVKNMVDDMVDDVWPELMEEVKYQIMISVMDPHVEVTQKKHICCLVPLCKIRYWYLYSMDPYDRTIWKRFKTISWWFWTLVSAIPFYGINQYFYAMDFLMRDKSDEYQLVQFILRFKTMFFVTQGIVKSVIGYFMFYACTIMVENSNGTKTISDDCSRKGPGASIQELTEVIGFLVQIGFIWISFLLLPMSVQKGRPRFLYEDSLPETGCCPRGGRIKYFMMWDIIALSASVGLFLLVFFLKDQPSFDNTGELIYFTEICYGLLSFPFLVFNVPFVKDRLTKAKATAYDKHGNCVPKSKSIKIEYKQDEIKKQKSFMDDLTLDVGEVFDG